VTDNAHFIVQAARERSEAALERAQQALRRLDRSGAVINVQAVAQTASVSRSWIYRHPEVRAQVEELRRSHTGRPMPITPSAQRASIESLQRRLEADQEELRCLRAENAALRDQVARLFGEQRVSRRSPRQVLPTT
jgi:hypothetical protein